MTAEISKRVQRVLEPTLVVVAMGFVVAYVVVALCRITYPFELEWMEGGMVDHVRRMLAGQPIYAKPSLQFVSFLYPPLYYVVAAGFAKVLGVGFLPLRLLSFLSSLGVLALIFSLVRRETGSPVPAAVAAGLFAASYQQAGAWYDLARLDSFYILILLAGIALLRRASSARHAAAAGLVLAAAFLTKQSAAVIIIPLAASAFLEDARRGAWFTGAAALTAGSVMLALERATGGWFSYYCFRIPARHPRIPGGAMLFWTADIFPVLALAAGGTIAFVAWRLLSGSARDRYFYPLLAVGMIGSSWSVRSVVGAEVNNLLPVLAAFSILTALGFDVLRRQVADSSGPRPAALAAAASVLLLAQLGVLAYDPRGLIPSSADRAAGERAVERLAAIPGEVFIPHHGYLAQRAGKAGSAHTLAMDNVFLDDEGPRREELARVMLDAIRTRRFAAVVLESDGRYREAILEGYEAREHLFDDPNVFWPVSGGRLRPEAICFPR